MLMNVTQMAATIASPAFVLIIASLTANLEGTEENATGAEDTTVCIASIWRARDCFFVSEH